MKILHYLYYLHQSKFCAQNYQSDNTGDSGDIIDIYFFYFYICYVIIPSDNNKMKFFKGFNVTTSDTFAYETLVSRRIDDS